MSTKYTKLCQEIKEEFPSFKVVEKETSFLMRALYTLLFMRLWCPFFVDAFTTVMKTTVYMPKNYIDTDIGYRILRHERVHMRDAKRWGVLYWLSYVLLPIGPSGRAYWEFRAYKESLQVVYEDFGYIPEGTVEHLVSLFTGPTYLFMLPFPKTIRNLLTKAKNEVVNGTAR